MHSNGKPIRILCADGQPIFRYGLRHLLQTQPNLRVVGEAGDDQQTLALAEQLEPDILLLGIAMPVADGLDVLRQLSREPPSVRTIVLAAGIEEPQMLEAFQLGARGIVDKGDPSDVLLKSICAVMAGQFWIGHKGIADLLDYIRSGSLLAAMEDNLGLTARELEIVSEILNGRTNKGIATKFAISTETVKRHLSTVYDKLGVSSRLELALFGVAHKMRKSVHTEREERELRHLPLTTTKVVGPKL